MTIYTLRVFGSGIAMCVRTGCVCDSAVQVCTFMTFHTVHTSLAEMYIAGEAFVLAEEFITDPAAVTGCAGTRHGWSLLKDMTGEESTAYILWLADMTLTASRMTGRAMITEHLLQHRVILWSTARIDRSPIAFLGGVQCKWVCFGLFRMTLTAILFGHGTWAGDQTFMRNIFFWRLHAIMTIGAGLLTMRGLRKRFIIDEHFLPWLQRSHIAPSANALGFAFCDLFGFGRVNETLFVGMTGETFIRLRLDIYDCFRFDGRLCRCKGWSWGGRLSTAS